MHIIRETIESILHCSHVKEIKAESKASGKKIILGVNPGLSDANLFSACVRSACTRSGKKCLPYVYKWPTTVGHLYTYDKHYFPVTCDNAALLPATAPYVN